MTNFSEYSEHNETVKTMQAEDILRPASTGEAEKVEGTVEDGGPGYIKFAKPFAFEDETYDGVDLTCLENMSAADMIATQRTMERSGSINVIPEMSLEYACIFAAKATKLPVEFFQALPPKEAIKVKNRVTNFFYSAD